MKPNEITGLLQAAGWQHKRVAEFYGCNPDFVSKVISGSEKSKGVMSYIAAILGHVYNKTYAEVWE